MSPMNEVLLLGWALSRLLDNMLGVSASRDKNFRLLFIDRKDTNKDLKKVNNTDTICYKY